ncbi:NADP-reducing hydrogenase subunit HndC [Oxobacter pfennigii]|uniref:NADP-reducing hydrogenase subunit HndC n=1 Tax=Oxobacter pfennigii TaxID=36849 RepID=A0A0P8Z2F6_9CLOT|nr:NADH-ubiquinone oxidoreductase-F iron-sulfur binding region domain-containing protein [Oxobacter pfennigii]KPU46346.1 NADP-reducing hydrogenase subunit HndC [Oxobacter pfennigii]
MKKNVEVLSSMVGKIRPDSVEDYVKMGGYTALKKAMNMEPLTIVEEVKKSNLMGRGGAAYPTGIGWEQGISNPNYPKYMVCNGDEGEPGTYKDRFILEGNPLIMIEGMTIAAFVHKIEKGYIYIRGEYSAIQRIVKDAIENAKAARFLGEKILGTDMNFDLEVISGAGAYVCGENTALVESIEGKSGRPRMKPPYLKNQGLYMRPTLLNNVETFSNIPYIVNEGGENYAALGYERSGGTKLVSLAGNITNKKVFEVPFGMTIREVIEDLGGGVPNGKKVKFVQMGGNSGACFPESKLDTRLDYTELKKNGMTLGSGAILVVDETNCPVDILKVIMEFFVHESCGKCTPCREGNLRILHLLEKLSSGHGTKADIEKIKTIVKAMKSAAFCGLGESVIQPVNSLLKHFKEEFEEHAEGNCRAGICPMNRE